MLDARKVKAEKPQNIRWRNESAIVALLQNNAEMTISEIAETLELSKTAATQTVNGLCREGVLRKVGIRDSAKTGGKPPRVFSMNESFRYTIVSIIGNDFIQCGIANMKCRILYSRKKNSIKYGQVGGWQAAVNTITIMVGQLLKESEITLDQICMMVVCCGGVVDRKTGVSMFPIGSKRENDFPISDILKKCFHNEFPVIVDNVGRFIGYAELLENPFLTSKNIVALFLHPSGGLGGCVIERGELLYGRHGYQGEFGHLLVETHHGRRCVCGNYGCLESMISMDAIKEMWKRMKHQFPQCTLKEGENGDIVGIFAKANEENPLAMAIVDQVALYVSRAVYNILLMYDPQLIILQGLLAYGGIYFMKKIEEFMKIFPSYGNAQQVSIVYSKISDAEEGFVTGAALYALNTWLFGNKYLPDRKG